MSLSTHTTGFVTLTYAAPVQLTITPLSPETFANAATYARVTATDPNSGADIPGTFRVRVDGTQVSFWKGMSTIIELTLAAGPHTVEVEHTATSGVSLAPAPRSPRVLPHCNRPPDRSSPDHRPG